MSVAIALGVAGDGREHEMGHGVESEPVLIGLGVDLDEVDRGHLGIASTSAYPLGEIAHREPSRPGPGDAGVGAVEHVDVDVDMDRHRSSPPPP